MHIAVIGAGAAGICAAKHALDNGYSVTVYEQTKLIGGTWVYTDEVGVDDYGLKIHSSMYKGLRTNFPKEIMGFPQFPFPEQEESYVSSETVLQFLNSYANNFNIVDHIKFQHYIVNVTPSGETQWEITVKDLQNNEMKTTLYDVVMVCNGHFSVPVFPNFDGSEIFHGKLMHSHEYRCPLDLKDEDVLIIGAGPSALDISYALKDIIKSLTISHHVKKNSPIKFPNIAQIKPDVKTLTKTGAEFHDGTQRSFTVIIYCTGYHYAFPFLDQQCGIYVDNSYVRPLYKQCINIAHPTMAIIGLPFKVFPFQIFDMQVRFFMRYLTGQKSLPSKEDMLSDTDIKMQKKWDMGYNKKYSHLLGEAFLKEYFDDLSETAEIENLKPVYLKMYRDNTTSMCTDFKNFRRNAYTIIDDETFIKIRLS